MNMLCYDARTLHEAARFYDVERELITMCRTYSMKSHITLKDLEHMIEDMSMRLNISSTEACVQLLGELLDSVYE